MNEYFLRNCRDIDEYNNMRSKDINYFEKTEYKIIERITISRRKFNNLLNDFHLRLVQIDKLSSRLLLIDSIAMCIEITCAGMNNMKIIAYTNGHKYLKYVAILVC